MRRTLALAAAATVFLVTACDTAPPAEPDAAAEGDGASTSSLPGPAFSRKAARTSTSWKSAW